VTPKMSAQQPDVVVVGSCNYDQFVYVPEFPAPGATIYGTGYATGFGGKGANQWQVARVNWLPAQSPNRACQLTEGDMSSVQAAKLGARTAMVGALGDDAIAANTRANFERVGVDSRFLLEKKGVSSGIAQICVQAKDGDNHIVLVPGANLELDESDVAAAEEMLSHAKVVLCQNEVRPSVSLAAMKAAKGRADAAAPLVILNAAPAPSIGDRWQEGQWREEQVRDMLSCCDMLCINESEAAKLSGLPVIGESSARAPLVVTGCNDESDLPFPSGVRLNSPSPPSPLRLPPRPFLSRASPR
jgi:ribokinase